MLSQKIITTTSNEKNISNFYSLLSEKDIEALKLKIGFLVKEMGFGGFLFSQWSPCNENMGGFSYWTFTNFSPKWMEKYNSEQFYLNDPALIHCHRSWDPLPWTSSLFKKPEVAAIHEEASLYGISAGCAIPINPDSCGFSFVGDQPPDNALKDVLYTLPNMKLLTGFLMEAISEIKKEKDSKIDYQLTKREVECVKLMAAGFRDTEISDRLNITFRTVVAHISNARQKTRSANRAQLIAKGVAAGII